MSDERGPRIRARRLPTPTRSQLARRAGRLAFVFARHLGPVALRQLRRARAPFDAATWARPLRRAFEDAGGTFVKFGQIVASSSGLFGEPLSEEFRSCLDTGPDVALADVRAVIEEELGDALENLFAQFDPVAVGRASIAVVHRAVLFDGRVVAVKVLRPRIALTVATDLDLMEPLFEILVRHTGDQLAGATLQQLDGLRQQVGEELDLRNEQRALGHFARLVATAGLDRIVVPAPIPSHCAASVLTMEFLEGAAIDDLAQAAARGIDPGPLVEQLIQAFFTMAVRWRTFHGDIHAGNLILLHDGRVGVVDWGIVGRLDDLTHRYFVRLLEAILGDDAAWDDVGATLMDVYGTGLAAAVGLAPDEVGTFVRRLLEPVLRQPFGQASIAQMMSIAQNQVAAAHGVDARSRSVGQLYRRLRAQRTARALALEGGGLMSEFDRGTFLLGKQLMYFERYGRMYLADHAILDDATYLGDLVRDARVGGTMTPPTEREPREGHR